MATSSSAKSEGVALKPRILNSPVEAIWHKTAPKAVRRAFAEGDQQAGWAAWRDYLAGRDGPAALEAVFSGPCSPLAWALPDGIDRTLCPPWLKQSGSKQRRGLTAWLNESGGNSGQLRHALEALACCHALPRLAEALPSEEWWALLDYLLAAVTDAAGIEISSDPDGDSPTDGVLIHQLLAGEAALTLALLLPEIEPCRKLKAPARRALSTGLDDLLDSDGLLHAAYLDLHRPLLACWTRCLVLGEQAGGKVVSKSAAERYDWLVRQTLRLTRCDGTMTLSNGTAAQYPAELFETALRLGGDKDDHALARLVLPPRTKKDEKKIISRSDLPEPSAYSEWAAMAVLRCDWSHSAPRLTVAFPGQSLRLELACGKDILLSGAWEAEIRFGGKPIEPESEWEEVCWVSDDDVDYLELEIEMTGGVRLQRQMCLAREDGFLLLADVVLGSRSGEIAYRGNLPLGQGVEFWAADESREGMLAGTKRRGVVMPLALPEWKADRRVGELNVSDGRLELTQAGPGPRMYAPLLIDLDRDRLGQRLTWRQLTVAEYLEIQPPEVAAGFRVAVGDEQWLIYRSLAPKSNRTLLGHNLSSEMLVAQFDEIGEVEPLLEIE